MTQKNDKNETSRNYLSVFLAVLSLGLAVFTGYLSFREGYKLDIILSNLFDTFKDPTIIFSYFAWAIFLIIYGVLNLYEKIHENGPEKTKDTLKAKNFYYSLWLWGAAAVTYQHIALTNPTWKMIYQMFPDNLVLLKVLLSCLIGLWGLHHVIAGRIFLNGYWDPDIHKFPDHEIISDGIYDFNRHPIYGGQFLFTVSLFVMWNNAFLIIFPLLTLIFNVLRANKEELELNRMLGEKYKEYKRFTPFYMFCVPYWSRLTKK